MKKILIILCVIYVLIPIILIVGIKTYFEIIKQIDYSKNKEILYDYINKEYGKEFELIRVEKEDIDFWTARTDTFYYKDKERDFVFEIEVENQEIFYDTYNEQRLGKEVENEFYKYLPENINLDFIFKAEAYDAELVEEHAITQIYSNIIVFVEEEINYKEIYKVYNYITNKFGGKDIDVRLIVNNKDNKEEAIKISNNEISWDDVDFRPEFSVNITNNIGFEQFVDLINESRGVY